MFEIKMFARQGLWAAMGVALLAAPASAAVINYTGVNGRETYAVSTTGVYQIVAHGAQGGNGENLPAGAFGGLGANIGGEFSLTAGQVLDLYIGQSVPSGGDGGAGGGGGGGTFVALDSGGTPGTLLVAAGGGGGASRNNPGPNANIETAGGNGTQFDGVTASAGGTNGSGGGGGSASGGGGYLSAGSDAGSSQGGAAFPTLTGGSSVFTGAGGFGGGGGAGNGGAGGGGGGYSGGGGGGSNFVGPGGGGGSYLDPAATNALFAVGNAGNAGNGFVSITLVPEPATLGAATILIGLAVSRRRATR